MKTITGVEFINNHLKVTDKGGKTYEFKLTEAQKNIVRISRQPGLNPIKLHFARRRLKNEMIDNRVLSGGQD